MITSFKKIRALGVFREFSAQSEIPEFKRFNVFYGDNGSGKTTLSRLFKIINDGASPDYPDVQFIVRTDTGDIALGDKCSRKIRVFNSDYVQKNLGQFDSPIKHILIVGEENRAIAEEIVRDEGVLNDRHKKIAALDQELERLTKDRGRVFSSIAATIGEAISGAAQRRYRKPDAEADYANLKTYTVLSDEALEVYKSTIRQEQGETVNFLDYPTVSFEGDKAPKQLQDSIQELSVIASELTQRSAQSGVLKRLAELTDVSSWVEQGLVLHSRHGSDHCEFCDQVLPAERIERLLEHFNEEDQSLKNDIEAALRRLAETIKSLERISVPPRSEFYSELRGQYDTLSAECSKRKLEVIKQMTELRDALTQKLNRRTTSYSLEPTISLAALDESVVQLNALVEKNNTKTREFTNMKAAASDEIVKSFLATIKGDVDSFDERLRVTSVEREKLKDGDEELPDKRGIQELEDSIRSKRLKITSEHAGADRMTKLLSSFLGRNDLKFESDPDGYRVIRHGEPARYLSEGEKTAISFLYFIVQLAEDFDVSEGIVVVDDPISSLDSSAIFQAFAYLKNALKGSKQLFLFTHNFDFLKLVLNWLKHGANKKVSSFLMLVCEEGVNGRSAYIRRLDKLLTDHPTEYHYLFKLLYQFKSDGTIAGCYHMPNVARKVLESFLEFYAPSDGSIYDKLDGIDFDENKKVAIYKFTNDMSHHTGKGFDPSIVAETQKNTSYLLEMIKTVAPIHFSGLEQLTIVQA